MRRWLTPVAVAAAALAWIGGASWLWCWGVGREYAFLAWWQALPYWPANWWCKLWIAIGAIGPSVGMAVVLSACRSVAGRWMGNDIYGKTGWAGNTDMHRGGMTLRRKP